jgi:small subunit ribosomal protein S9|tara:strand:+ start:700 stop:1098 length:399 start_codon:yes stop_codon:yes gene_type:complete
MKIIQTSGKRKTAIARAMITKGIGKIRINKIPLEIIEPELSRMKITEPLLLAGELAEKVDINVNVKGGGIMGQAEAVRTAIGRGLIEYSKDAKLKAAFSDYDKTLLKSDPRRKETKKFGGKGARSKKQKSYR